uniref:hypothetical protein n=1 Tax=uncultured Phenylobacterium sp. TaxID=349273 RepID=UPI0025E9CE43
MAVRVVPYEAAHEPLVQAFNRRLAERGTTWGFYAQATPKWLAAGETPNARRDFYLGLDDDGVVRAGYCLKPEHFLLQGEPFEFTSIQGPVSEGLVDPAYRMLALQLIRDMESRASHLFAWGASDRVLELLLRLKWRAFQAPLQLRIQRPSRFLRHNAFLRQEGHNRVVLDILARSGAGGLGVSLAQAILQLSGRGARVARTETTQVERFGSWADHIWSAAGQNYGLIARRDQATMNAMVPAVRGPPDKILQMRVGRTTKGSPVVMDSLGRAYRRLGA